MKKNILLFILLLFFFHGFSTTFYSRATGNWNSASTWSTVNCGGTMAASTPVAGDIVNICSSHTVSVTANVTTGSVTINTGGTLKTGTSASGANKTVTITGTFTIQNGGTYIHNNNQIAATTIFAGNEVFGPSSTISIDSWSDTQDSLVAGVASNFGNLNFNWDTGLFLWKNSGLGSFRTVAGNLTTNLNCATYLNNTTADVIITIGGTLTVGDEFRVKTSNSGNATLNVGSLSLVSADGFFMGIYQGNGIFTLNTSSVTISNGTAYGTYNGDGNVSFNVNGTFTQSGGAFLGIRNNATFTAGVPSYNITNLNFSGGVFIGNSSCNTTGGIINFNITNNLNITYSDSTALFAINRLATLSTTSTTCGLNMTVGGNMTIGGTANGEFNSNNGTGSETINVTGTLSVSAGKIYFNVIPAFGTNGHGVNMTLGALTVSGGNLYLSSETGTLTVSVAGATSITGGSLTAKANTGTGNVNFNGSYTQSGGTFYLHNNTTLISANVITATAFGSFTQSGGTINFSNNAIAGNATNVLAVKGNSYSIGSAGSMTRAGALTGTQFGSLVFNAAGTTSFNRSGAHSIQQVKQVVNSGTTLDVVSGNIQVASHSVAAIDYFTIASGGIVSLRSNQLFSDAAAVNSGITVSDGGRLRIQHANGLYNNSTAAAISNAGNMNFSLGANSIVEYYATSTQILSGINTGIATGTQHKYGILDINYTGAANTSWVYPTALPSVTTAIYIRTELRLTSGELNLTNSSGIAVNGGRTITIENGASSAISRTNGYIKSECQDLSAVVKWKIGSATGNHIIPFGYNSSNYIPVTLNAISGSTGDASVTTYHTPATNLPWPPGVNNLISAIGLTPDNRDATTDRFWFTLFTGTPNLTLSLTYAASELPVIAPYNNSATLQAHRFNTGGLFWESPLPGQATGVNSITIPTVPSTGIWAMASNQSPLPVELLSFEALKKENAVLLYWNTASEKDNDHFTIERSADLKNITDIGSVKGVGNSSFIHQYSLTDEQPLEGLSYYRLRQTDINGDQTLSEWIKVKYSKESTISIYPNPAGDYIYIEGNDLAVNEIRILDMMGTVQYQSNNLTPGIDVNNLREGSYVLQMIQVDKVVNLPFIINR